jgi:hypothetical protein
MFMIKRKNDELDFILDFNSSLRFHVGKDSTILILEKGVKRIGLKGKFIKGEVIESEVLYRYKIEVTGQKKEESLSILQFYKYLLDRANSR